MSGGNNQNVSETGALSFNSGPNISQIDAKNNLKEAISLRMQTLVDDGMPEHPYVLQNLLFKEDATEMLLEKIVERQIDGV